MPRLLQLINTFDTEYGGPVQNAFGLHRALNRATSTSAVLMNMGRPTSNSVVDDFKRRAVNDLPKHAQSICLVSRVSVLKQVVRCDAVLVHGYYFWWVPLVTFACFLFRKSLYVTPHGSLTGRQRGFSIGKKRIYEAAAGWFTRRYLTSFIVGSQDEAEDLRRTSDCRVEVGGVGTDIPPTRPAVGGPSKPLRLLSLSRLHPKKNVDVSIRAVRELVDMGIDCELRIAGSGANVLVEKLEALAQRLEVSNRVRFLGEVLGPAKTAEYVAADIYLLPSEEENFGISLAEALAHGAPVVTTQGVAAAGFLSSEAGRVVPSPDPVQIGQAVISLLDTDDYDSRRDAAHAVAARYFGWDAVARNWARILWDN